jgi:hypothetical protein
MPDARAEDLANGLDLFAEPTPGRDRLPTPPLRLRHIRLHGVGPDGARFDPLDLDFTTSDGAAARVLLSLTNTGGKSTLITLVSSLLVPAARAQISGKNLGDYVLTGDTSHIVCEWEDADSGVRTVTGAVMEWKDGRRQPGHRQRSTTNMHRAWYLFRTGTGLPGIDDLPFVIDGRRASYHKYIAAVTSLMMPHDRTRWVLATSQQDWARTLDERTSLDPVLFGYQMRMNDSEAGAEKLLADFNSPDNVVRFFVAALNDDREIADLTGKLGAYAALAGRRPRLEALAAFGAQIAPLVSVVAQRKTSVDETAATAVTARAAGGEHAAALSNRIARDEAALNDLKEETAAAARELAAARRDYGQISDIRLQLLLEQARAELAHAACVLEERTHRADEAELEAAAWQAVDAVLDFEIARQERDSAKAAYDAAHSGLTPLRHRVAAAATALAGRLEGLVAEAETAALEADKAVAAAHDTLERALEKEKTSERQRGEAIRLLEGIEANVRAGQNARDEAAEGGWLLPDENPGRCLQRWQDAVRIASSTAEEEDSKAADAESQFDARATELQDLNAELTRLRTIAESSRARLEAFDAELAEFARSDEVLALLGGEPADVADASRAAEMASRAASDSDNRAAGHERLAQAAREELAHLDQTGTAPAGADVMAVLEVLQRESIGAVTGLDWIERNIPSPDDRAAFIADRADLAAGVIVSDPSRFAPAIQRITAASPRTRTPVTVTTTPASTVPAHGSANGQPRHVVLPHRATWDRAWAAATRAELDKTATTEGNAAAQARDTAARHREAAAQCGTFTAHWQPATRQDLRATATASADEVNSTEQQHQEMIAGRNQLRQTARACRERAAEARSAAQIAAQNAAAAGRLAELSGKAKAARQQRPSVEANLAGALRQLAAAAASRKTATGEITAKAQEAAQARSDQVRWQQERSELGVDDSAADPGGNLAVVRASWVSLQNELAAAEQGLVEAEFLNRAQRNLTRVTERRDRFPQQVLDRAGLLAASAPASSPESRTGAQQRARDDALHAEKQRLRAETGYEQAGRAVQAAAPASEDRQNHIDLSHTPEWLPVTSADIPAVLERLEVRNAELLERRDEAEQTERDAQELHGAVETDIAAFSDTIAMWPAEKMPTSRAYTGTRATARDEMRVLVKEYSDADSAERAARDALHDAVAAVRAAVSGAGWRELDTPAAVRVRSLPEADLVTEAAVLARRIQAMAESASADLSAMDVHRTILRRGLLGLCREQRRMLREVSRASRLPEGLSGDLPGTPAIKIGFQDAPDDEAAGRLADRIDSWAMEIAANPKRASSADVRARWLADAVRDTVIDRARAGPWSIEVLKPRIDGRVAYCPPERIPQEFSGGQVLTLAVLVYCALSGVRSAHRPGGARPPGTLILDNPFGTASAETLIAMQHRLAAHTGLQLVCATGLHDAGIAAAFTGPGSVIVKLRNDGDLRRNLSFLRMRSRVVDGIDIAAAITAGRDTSAAQNWVDATGYAIRR